MVRPALESNRSESAEWLTLIRRRRVACPFFIVGRESDDSSRAIVSCDRLVDVDDDLVRDRRDDRRDGRREDPASRVSTVLLDVGAAHGGKRGRRRSGSH